MCTLSVTLLISDPHTEVSEIKRSRRGRRAVSPDAGALLQPDIGNSILSITCAHCQLHC